jgi:thiol-disulfide isomerase/thioredoxin
MFAAGGGQAAPTNDDFINATVLTGITNLVVTSNVGASREAGEPAHADSAGGKSIWWSWQSPFTGSVRISTEGSAFDTLLAVYAGDSISDLEAVADNDDDAAGGFGTVTSSLVFRALAGETYRIAVDGFNGASGAVRLGLGRAGRPAPAWALNNLDGNRVGSTDFPRQVLLIDFWETTCAACVDELPDLIRLQQNLSPEGLTFFGVSKDIKGTDVKEFVQDHEIPYDIAMSTYEIESAFGGDVGLPTKFVIDRENMLVGKYFGGVNTVEISPYNFYVKLIKPLLRGSKEVQLSVGRQSGTLVFAWPAAEFGYNLESATLLGGTNWTVASSPVVIANDRNTVTIQAPAATQFFRLRKTPPVY